MKIGYVGMIGALFTFLILVLRMSIEEFLIQKKKWSSIYIKFIISYLIQGITVIVVAVPEGLPLAVALALSFATQKMTKDNNLVRHLDACETMGNATTICSDKTGTLTTNRMTAVKCWIANMFYENIHKEKISLSDSIKELIYESISVNSNYASLIEVL
jgi:P-type E1-E2 ATPase